MLKKMLRGECQNTLRCGNQLIELTNPLIMGIVNATPDSFYAFSRADGTVENALAMARRMLSDGAIILDIGGMSTRPGAKEVTVSEEIARVVPVIEAIHTEFPQAIISVDTYRAIVAEESIKAGATMVNDVSGGQLDEGMFKIVAEKQVAYVMMHLRGTPETMHQYTDYKDVVSDLIKYFIKRLQIARQAGVSEIILDPGFGFAKTMEQNYEIIQRHGSFRLLHKPLLVGISRKSTLSKTIGRPADEALEATTALHMVALQNGASILRVHDVLPARDTIAVFNKIRSVDHHDKKRLSRI